MHGGEEIIITHLNLAAAEGHADAVRVLMSRGAEVNEVNPYNGNTAPHAASEEGHVHVIELLMSKGASVDVRDNIGLTPLHKASFLITWLM